MQCPNCSKSIPPESRFCINCGYSFPGNDLSSPMGYSPPSDEGRDKGFDLLRKGDLDGAFEAWAEYVKGADKESAEGIYDQIIDEYIAYMMARLKKIIMPTPTFPMPLCSAMDAALEGEKSLLHDIIRRIGEQQISDENDLYTAWYTVEYIGDEYAKVTSDIDALASHFELMADLSDMYEREFAMKESGFSKDAAASACFYRDVLSRMKGAQPKDQAENAQDYYEGAKKAHCKSTKASNLMSDMRRKNCDKAMALYMDALLGV